MEQPDFNSPVIGTDPITKGTFTIDWARVYETWDPDTDEEILRALADITIHGIDNPLYDAVVDTPLNLQGLLATVLFGVETRFIKITKIPEFARNEVEKSLHLYNATFMMLTNLQYFEQVQDYRDTHHD